MFLNRLNGEPIGVSVLGIFVIDKNTLLAVRLGLCKFQAKHTGRIWPLDAFQATCDGFLNLYSKRPVNIVLCSLQIFTPLLC